jgi:UDP-galactopyranose mutase
MTGFRDPLDDEPNTPPAAKAPAPSAASQPPPRREDARIFHDSYEIAVPAIPDLVCLSHLRWDFVFQRPQHLMTRFAKGRRVFFVEEPVFGGAVRDRMGVATHDHVVVATPHLPAGLSPRQVEDRVRLLLNDLMRSREIADYLLWYYTPMAMGFTRHLFPRLVVWDCMDELTAFAHAPTELIERERQLLQWADLMFTGGQSLYEAKRSRHDHVHAFPSSIDAAHFAKARRAQGDPADQAQIPRPRIGFYGVIDERLDIALLREMAALKPDWHWVLIGPVVKIDPQSLPRLPNLHWLGKKDYAQLPAYLSGWDAAMLPFARNPSTRFISPTKTPEYLAAGRPVVSTPIRDVVRPYGDAGLVRIAEEPQDFVAALEEAMLDAGDESWRARVDSFLAGGSWDRTHADMLTLIEAAIAGKSASRRAATARLPETI